MAPEIVSKIPYVGFPVDIWAAGVVLYAMLSGDFPYKGFYYLFLINLCILALLF